MTRRRRFDRAGAATGNLLVILSVLALGAAIVYPRVQESGSRARVTDAVERVDAIRGVAARYHDSNQDLPETLPPGELPQGFAVLLPPGFTPSAPAYTIAWERWELVDRPPPPPAPPVVDIPQSETATPDAIIEDALDVTIHSFGSLSVHSGDEALLAGLLERYGPDMSFVRDSTWTLILPLFSAPLPRDP